MTLEGIDVSAFQGTGIQWHRVRASGRVFAEIKASEGLNFRDPTFSGHWHYARSAGLIRGAYHYLHPNEDGAEQADVLHGWVREHGGFSGHDYIMLDLEEADLENPLSILESAEDFVQRAWQQTQRKVILYTGPWFWTGILGNPRSAVLEQCPLSLADYGAFPSPPPGWGAISIWQYSSSGRVPGVNGGDVDLDRFYGDWSQLQAVTAPLT